MTTVNAQSRFDIFRLQRENDQLKRMVKLCLLQFKKLEIKVDNLDKEFKDFKDNIEIEEIYEEINAEELSSNIENIKNNIENKNKD